MILIDTGFFLASINVKDSLHSRAKEWATLLGRNEQFLVTEYVLWETVNFASKPILRMQVHPLVERIRSQHGFEFLPASPTLLDAGLRLHSQRLDKRWSLTDCISFLVMNDRGMSQALAHDEHFEQAGFEALLRRSPTE